MSPHSIPRTLSVALIAAGIIATGVLFAGIFAAGLLAAGGAWAADSHQSQQERGLAEAPASGQQRTATGPIASIIDRALSDPHAYERLGDLCDRIGARPSGSPQMQRAIAWAVAAMRADGLDSVWTEPVQVRRWVRGREWARVIAPVQCEMSILGLGGSIGTPGEVYRGHLHTSEDGIGQAGAAAEAVTKSRASETHARSRAGETHAESHASETQAESRTIEAEILAVSDFAELEARASEAAGKIVLFDPPWEGYGKTVEYRTRGASAAAKHGAVACLIRSVTGTSLGTLHAGMMSYEEGVPRIPAAALTVEDAGRIHRLCQRGHPVRVQLTMEAENHPDATSANVIAEVRGSEWPEQIVLVGGHLDSWDVGTGAHDDGAGCVIAMEAARLLKALRLQPKRTVRVVLFASEEFGARSGRGYLEAHRDELDRHVAALESDSGGFAPRGFTVKAGESVINHVRQLALPLADLGAEDVSEGWAGVDIGPVVAEGVPGIGHRTHHEAYFDYHHSPADTFDKIVAEDFAKSVAAVAALVYALSEDRLPLSRYQEDTE